MIFVTLGTQKISFVRLLEQVDELIESEHITEDVFVQMGHTDYTPKHFRGIRFLSEADFQKTIREASVIITHAGSGALFSALNWNRKVIACARLQRYGEMIDDHQTELTRKLSQEGYIIDGTESIINAWRKLADFTPRKNDFDCKIPQVLEQLFTR